MAKSSLLENYERKKQLDKERKRPATEKSNFSIKEWVGIIISIAAFVVSGFTTYVYFLSSIRCASA
ncbi:MAG: hypothetical protein QOD11_848 [Bradyrhizobium sp.]|jgi:uncharacterized membrane protein YukC|nr:hypothetical protein [Bradyrhizobium sp.]